MNDIAQRLAAHPRFRWAPGMSSHDGNGDVRVLNVGDDGVPNEWVFRESRDHLYKRASAYGSPGWAAEVWSARVPDLADSAAAGVLLGMLWEALPTAEVFRDVDNAYVVWDRRMNARSVVSTGPTLGHAVAEALLAVWPHAS